MNYEKDLAKAMEQFVKDIKAYTVEGGDFKFFWSNLQITAKEGGQNIAAVAKVYLEGSCRVNLLANNNLLVENWNGDLATVPETIEDGKEYLLQVYLF